MNDMIVGMENLPNVFIDKILIYPSDIGIKIELLISMYDHKEKQSWHKRDLGLKLKVLFESRQDIIEPLNSGEISLHDAIPETEERVVTTGILSPQAVGIQGDYEKFTIKLEKNLNLKNNLNIYAACFVDNLGFNNHPVFSKYYGPMAAEQIFVGGQLNTLSNYFYYPDTNEEYGGPVHIKPDGSFMEGSEHSDKAHKDLRLVTEENYKIQAYNIDFDIGLAAERESELPDSSASNETPVGPEANISSSPTTAVAPTGVPTPGGRGSGFVSIEDPNVPDSTPDRIY